MRSVAVVQAEAGRGLIGDRYHGTRHRHVSIQSREQLDRGAEALSRTIDSRGTRRNLTVDAGEIPSRPGDRLSIGAVELEVVRIAAPCRLLDDDIGSGAAAALRGRAGSVCRILTSGSIHLGDIVEVIPRAVE
ncbi:MOSC domain-containing protein [Mycolicibacterium sp. XJ2]